MKLNNGLLLFIPVVIVLGYGMFIDIMEVDAAQYAAMSAEMLQTGQYLQISFRGQDYIDKPPFVFWVSAWSFKLLGVSNFSYRLPSVLFTLLGLFATYRLGKLLYNQKTGFYAALVLASSQAWFLINHDVRTDTILAAATIVSVWQLTEFITSNKRLHLLYASFGVAIAMLTKGPIGLMVPAMALGTHFVLKGQWRNFLRWEWFLLCFIVLLLLTPMLYGLYQQFDSGPGKQTYNGFITSGLRFYFWTQSFGRITGESSWQNDSGPFFFVHTFLWAFLPWSLLFSVAFARQLVSIVRQRFKPGSNQEAITLGGIVFPFIAFSMSHYKLPHYIFVFFPLMAIVTAHFLHEIVEGHSFQKIANALQIAQGVIAMLLLMLASVLCVVCFYMDTAQLWLAATSGTFISTYYFFKGKNLFQRLIIPSFAAIVTVNLLLNIHVYPKLLTYQSATVAARKVKASGSGYPLIGFRFQSYSLDFYYQSSVPYVDTIDQLQHQFKGKTIWVFTNADGYAQLSKSTLKVYSTEPLESYHVSMVKAAFLNPYTRKQATSVDYLLLVQVPGSKL